MNKPNVDKTTKPPKGNTNPRPKGKYINQLRTKKFKTFGFDGVFKDTMGNPETNGIWLVYGAEKNGKTWFSLMLAEYLSQFNRTLYVSAEEGMGKDFVEATQRAQLAPNNKSLLFYEYTEITVLDEILSKRQAPKIIFLDNMTIYNDELKNGILKELKQKHSSKLFVIIAHEERNEPYTATAKLARKLASIIVNVKGLACFVSGRCPGGALTIDEEKAQLYHGTEILN